MLSTLSLIRREFGAYFLSPIAYVVLAVFLGITGHLFYLTLLQLTAHGPRGVEFPLQLMLGDDRFWLVFLFIPPLLTMRLFAEERSSGTLEMLLTAPLRDWQVVLAKYLGCLGFYVLMWLPTLAYLPVLLDVRLPRFTPAPAGPGWWDHTTAVVHAIGPWVADVRCGIDPYPVLTAYLGLFLAGAMFLALGLYVSSLVRSQMVAALVALFLSLIFIAGMWRPEMDTGSLAYRVLYFFTVPLHFHRDFSRGIIDTRHLVLYGSVALFCLFLTVRSLETRRWR